MLDPSSRLAVVAPAGPFSPEPFSAGLAFWRRHWDTVDLASDGERCGYLAASDAARATSLLGSIERDDVHGILCARGGFGVTRLLAHAGPGIIASVREHPKPIVGFSDVTALHAVWSLAGVRSVHGPMVVATGQGNPYSGQLADLLRGNAMPAFDGLTTVAPGRHEGIATGGNLAVLCALLGTPFFPDMDGRVLFLEDVTERPYRIDRMLTSLRLAGVFDRVGAVVFGDFDQCDAGPDGVTVEGLLHETFGSRRLPVLSGAPFGHGARTAPFVLGARVRVDADVGRVEFLEGL